MDKDCADCHAKPLPQTHFIGWLKSCRKSVVASLQDRRKGIFRVNALPERLTVKGPKLSRHSIAGNTFDAFEAFLHEIGA
jgi:hypothetical protein